MLVLHAAALRNGYYRDWGFFASAMDTVAVMREIHTESMKEHRIKYQVYEKKKNSADSLDILK